MGDWELPHPAEQACAEAEAGEAGLRQPRWCINRAVKAVLEEVYRLEKFPSTDMRRRLSVNFGVTPRQVQFWFQNRRQRDRKVLREHSASMLSAQAGAPSAALAPPWPQGYPYPCCPPNFYSCPGTVPGGLPYGIMGTSCPGAMPGGAAGAAETPQQPVWLDKDLAAAPAIAPPELPAGAAPPNMMMPGMPMMMPGYSPFFPGGGALPPPYASGLPAVPAAPYGAALVGGGPADPTAMPTRLASADSLAMTTAPAYLPDGAAAKEASLTGSLMPTPPGETAAPRDNGFQNVSATQQALLEGVVVPDIRCAALAEASSASAPAEDLGR